MIPTLLSLSKLLQEQYILISLKSKRCVPVVADDDDGVDGVKLEVGELSLLLLGHHLLTQGLVLVHVQVIHKELKQSRSGHTQRAETVTFRSYTNS